MYMRTFDATAERRLARQLLTEWRSTLVGPSDTGTTQNGLGRDLHPGVYEQHNAIDIRLGHRRCRTSGPTSTTPSAEGSGPPPDSLPAHTAATPFLEK